MKKILIATVLLATGGVFAAEMNTAPADKKPMSADMGAIDTKAEAFKLIHVNDLAAWMTSKTEKTYVFDANNKQVRTTDGVIPGAKLLTSSDKYNVAKTLPQDKSANLVFYCANEACTASHNAAKRAIDAGYTKVSVLADGIKGWVKAGKPVSKKS